MDLIQFIVGSSTPDGMAPLSKIGVSIFVGLFACISMIWGALNFYILLQKQPLQQQSSNSAGSMTAKIIRITEMCGKILMGALRFLQFNFIICLVAAVIFLILIMGTIEKFNTFDISLSYAIGALNSILIGVAVSIASSLSYSRICSSSGQSLHSAYLTGKNIANFIAYFVPGLTLLALFLIMILYQKEEEAMSDNDIKLIGQSLLGFAFGASTVAIGTKINGVIYSKGAQSAMSLVHQIEGRVKRDDKHPVIICKAIGDNLNKSVANVLDYAMYLSTCVAVTVAAGGSNIYGVDQEGEITFDRSLSNAYLPFLAIAYALFFSVTVSIACNYILVPSSGEDVVLAFKRQIYIVIVFLLGFLSLAAYLSLPAEFQSFQCDQQLKRPYFAYLILIISMVLMFLLMFIAELFSNHPRFVYSLIDKCRTGAATNIISGLSFGYFSNIIPVVSLTGLGFLAYFWLGSYGVALAGVGFATLLPNYLGINSFCATSECSSMIGVVTQSSEQMIGNLMQLSDTKRSFEPQIHSHLTSFAIINSYCLFLVFVINAQITDSLALTQPTIFSGLLLGGTLTYAFSAVLVRSIFNVAPVMCYDLRAQVEETPGIIQGNVDPDHVRTNYFYSINTILQMKFMLPFFFGPHVVIGIAFGPLVILGTLVGMIISGIQLSISSGSMGFLWNSARAQIFLGRAKDENGNAIKPSSQQGAAADVGNDLGSKMKDAIGLGLHGYITYVCLLSTVMSSLYCSIYS